MVRNANHTYKLHKNQCYLFPWLVYGHISKPYPSETVETNGKLCIITLPILYMEGSSKLRTECGFEL